MAGAPHRTGVQNEGAHGTGKDAVLWALAALILAWGFAMVMLPRIAPTSDLWDYSQEARQIARGQGFTSLYTYPPLLDRDGPPFPVRWRMPLLAAVGAGLLRLGIPLPAGYLYFAALAHALLVGLAYFLAARLRGSGAGSVAAVVALACPLLIDAYSPANSQIPNAALHLITWSLLLLGGGARSAALAGVSAAAAWYLRGESALMVPFWLAAAVMGRGPARWQRGVAFALVVAAVCAPWVLALRYARGAFSPVELMPTLLHTPEFPGYTSIRVGSGALPGLIDYVSRYPASFALRYGKDAVGFSLEMIQGLGPVAVGLVVASLLLGRSVEAGQGPRRPGRAGLMTAAVVWQILALSALERSPRFIAPVVPLACVLVGMSAASLLEYERMRRAASALLVAALLERGATIAFQTAAARRAEPALGPEVAQAIGQTFAGEPRGALILSDVPDWVAWRLDRAGLFLPMSRDLGGVMGERPVAGIYLSPLARARNAADRDAEWVRVIDGAAPIPGFMGPEILADGSRIYVRQGLR